MTDGCSVKVAVRVRPMAPYETHKGSKDIVDVVQQNEQIVVHDKNFTFNYAFGSSSTQSEVYERSVQKMISRLFDGYNVTILAYGQTGSGKTHTMGTAYKGEGEMGVIPRAVEEIFQRVRDNFALDFNLSVSFVELYQEVLYDLLAGRPRDQCTLDIREDVVKGNYIPGLTEVPVGSAHEVLEQLAKGSLGRATGSTNMNSQSSRSHAIFTLNIALQHKDDPSKNVTAKLHLVDLAGSERPKKTGAVGNTFREGININKGLFVLGNVISCLGDESKSGSGNFVPYRDSNLTRLLKDSLGGNSLTLMIACISPADYNMEETVSTLRYADRAKKIRNKPVVNQDPHTAELNKLKNTIVQLRLQLVGQGGPQAMVSPAEIAALKAKIAELERRQRELTLQLSAALVDNTELLEKLHGLQACGLTKKLEDLGQDFESNMESIDAAWQQKDLEKVDATIGSLADIRRRFDTISREHREQEIHRSHDETFVKMLSLSESCGSEADTPAAAEMDEQQTTEYSAKQLNLNADLQNCLKELVLKQSLAKQLAQNVQSLVDPAWMQEQEDRIVALQKEKEDIVSQQQPKAATSKLSEQRRKRLKELEQQIGDLKKKVAEQARLIKLREKDELRIKQLGTEITTMKQTKVRLMRTIREESERFRTWKRERERELNKLKQQDRKKTNEIAKIKLLNSRQQSVLKRKVEEAHALNKRLQESLHKRKLVQDMKNTDKTKNLKSWMQHEFEVFLDVIAAQETVQNLLDDRGKLQEQCNYLVENGGAAAAEEVRTLKEDIECRSAQIQDLQNKILESDEGNKSKTRFDAVIHSNAEARQLLRTLFEEAAPLKRHNVQLEMKLAESMDNQNNLKECQRQYETNLKTIEDQYSLQMHELQAGYEQKVWVLLCQLQRGGQDSSDGPAADVEGEWQHLCSMLQDKNDRLEEQLAEQRRLLDNIHQTAARDALSAETPLNKRTVLKQAVAAAADRMNSTFTLDAQDHQQHDATFVTANDDLDSSIGDFVDDDSKDPDWRKTPLGKKILTQKKRWAENESNMMRANASKRSYEGGCTCKTTCGGRCGCRKLRRVCDHSCKCEAAKCLNQHGYADDQQSMEVSSTNPDGKEAGGGGGGGDGDGDGDEENDDHVVDDESFKRPRLQQEQRQRIKRRKDLFRTVDDE